MSDLLEATKEKMVGDTRQVIRQLSEIYNFNVEDAFHKLSISESPPVKKAKVEQNAQAKAKAKVEPKAKLAKQVILPWCGQVIEGNCIGIRFNKGLFTQCKSKQIGNKKCVACSDTNKRLVCCGDIRQRNSQDWSDVKGRKPVRYSKIMAKIGITKNEAIEAASAVGWTIPDIEFSTVTPARRGRPPMTKPLVSTNTGNLMLDDLISGAREMHIDEAPTSDTSDLTSEFCRKKMRDLFGTDSDDEEQRESDYEVSATPTLVITVKGTKYLFDERTNSAYDMQTQIRVGVTTPGRSQFERFWQRGLID